MPALDGPILVTGASGFVGRRLIARLANGDRPVVPVAGVGVDGGCDLRDRAAVERLVGQVAPAGVVHLAAMSSVGRGGDDALRTWKSNVAATANLAHACLAVGRPVRFVFASSAEVYGASFLDGPCDEQAALRPLSTYARTKAAAEWLLRDLASPQLQILVARPFNHVGVGQDTRFVLPSFAEQIVQAGTEGRMKVGNLDAQRDFSDVDDLIDALEVLTRAPHDARFDVFNIGSGHVRTIGSLLDDLIALSGARIVVQQDPDRMRPSEVPVARGVFDAFDRAFGPRTRRKLDETLRDVLDAARATRRRETP